MTTLSATDKQAILGIQRNNLSEYIRRVFSIVSPNSDYKHNWHIDLIAEYLVACQKGDITRLIINIPPRFLKSISVSVAFPSWLLGHNPSEQIMCASYSKDLAMTLGVNCRSVIQTDWYQALFPETILADDQNTKTKFKTTKEGSRYSVGVGGTITGEGCNFLLIDDAISAQNSNSKVVRDDVNNWFGQTAYTRLNDRKKGVIVVIMQRLHQNDLTGYLLDQGSEWEHLKIPLVSEEKKTYQIGNFKKEVEIGDLLHPNLMGVKEIDSMKRTLGPYNFAGQYMQTPSPTGGGEFRLEWLHYYEGKLPHDTMNIYITVDPADAKGKNSDFTCMCVLGLGSDENVYLLDMVRDKLNLRERQLKLFELHQKYKPKGVLYEKYGKDGDISAMNEAMDYNNYRFVITEVGGRMTKHQRIERLIPWFADGRIWLPRDLIRANYEGKMIDIIDEFVNQEYLVYPVGNHDDAMDAMSRLFDTNLIWPGKNDFNYYQFAEGFK